MNLLDAKTSVVLANWCPAPPDAVAGGFLHVNSTGNRFGRVCPGSDIDGGNSTLRNITVSPESDGLVTMTYEQLQEGKAQYNLFVYTGTVRADKIYFKIRFDAPVTSIEVCVQPSSTLFLHGVWIT